MGTMSSIEKNFEDKKYVNSVLCSIPVETPGGKLRRKRSEGPVPIMPKNSDYFSESLGKKK